ncbi:hypothetical protein BDE18_2745 [Paracoccus pantotrophus]|uniref:Transposase n=1 Tax=Paracoccus pantotrophus TaxID=82367 RepID=A0ABX9S6X9_PARPN|nr:hypothetical protein [Paracoccus pantotrophus]RKS43920.1 hypothetical protein BDE18_2745 [Paracoccus pantotrophus]
MAEKRHKPDEIVTKLRRLDVLRGHPARELLPDPWTAFRLI